MIWPVDVRTVTQEFAAYPNPDYQPDGHTGMDFGVNVGTPIRAAGPGTVLWANWAQGLGWPNPYYIAIDFDGPWNGDQSAGIVVVIDHGHCATLYAHLDQTGLNPGDKVREGEVIGQTGNTGRSSGPHLHFEVLPDGWDVNARWYGRRDPRDYIKASTGIAAQGTATTPTPTTPKEPFTMAQYDDIMKKLTAIGKDARNTWSGVWTGGTNIDGQKFKFGILPIVAHNQTLIASQSAQIKALVGAIAALAKGETLDEAKLLAGVQAAAEAGVKAGIQDGTVTVDVNVNGAQ